MITWKETAHLRLQRARPPDAALYHSLMSDLRREPELQTFLGPISLNAPADYERSLARLQGKQECPFMIYRKDTTAFIGICGFRNNNFVGAIEIYIWIGKDHRHSRFGTEAGQALIEIAFESGCDLVVGVPHPRNCKSIRLLSKLKMRNYASIWDISNWDAFSSTHQHPVYGRHKNSDLDRL